METFTRNIQKSNAQSSKGESQLASDIPEHGEIYRSLCPVDHKNNCVAIRGVRSRLVSSHPPIVIIHDVAEKSEMYWDCIKFICDKGFSSYIYDQRGHGSNTELSGHLDRFQDLVSDLLQVTSWVRHMHAGIAPLIVGQGYGAIVATELACKFPHFVTGIVLAAPTLELAWKPGTIKRHIIKLMADIAPQTKVPQGLHPRFSNPLHREVGKTMATRFLRSLIGPRQLRLSFAFAQELFEAMDGFDKSFHALKKPVLILKPGNDEVASYGLMDQIAKLHPEPGLVRSTIVANVHHNGFTEGHLPMASILEEVLTFAQTAIAWPGREANSKT